ncbi:MAG TPA: carboxypeptidase regulatory-like domain-containing protein [Candidatus Dormibacteraeota bacterium]|nr:carboxypeptidase regulatory-like domain-containing protein [Candidatus Dormibacteraeota bacterium]
MKKAPICWFILLALGAASGNATAGTIRGQVRVPPADNSGLSAPNPYPGRASSLAKRAVAAWGSVLDAVIYVEEVPSSVDSTLADAGGTPAMEQKDQAFGPRVLAVPVGTTVAFPNRDPIFHSVFSVSPVKRFDLGKYGRGKSKSVKFTKAGVVNVYCDIHSDMAGFVLVVPNHAYVQPDADGRFALPSLPPGTYTVIAWHPDLKSVRRTVQIPETGDVTVDLGL